MTEPDLATPPTEQEVSRALDDLESEMFRSGSKDILRRLAFDQNRLKGEVDRLSIRSIIQKLTDQASAIRHDHLEIFAAAFVVKTDLDPRECELVEEHVGTEIRWHFRKRTP